MRRSVVRSLVAEFGRGQAAAAGSGCRLPPARLAMDGDEFEGVLADLETHDLIGPPPTKTKHDFLSMVLKLREDTESLRARMESRTKNPFLRTFGRSTGTLPSAGTRFG